MDTTRYQSIAGQVIKTQPTIYMNAFDIFTKLTCISAALLTVGCVNYSTVSASNGTSMSIPAPRMETTNKVVDVEVAELVNGSACRTTVLGVFVSGDTHLLLTPDQNLSTELEKTKAAAGFDALFNKMKDHPPLYHDTKHPFPNDMLLAPTYHTQETRNAFEHQICVTVSGYRGRIKALKDADTTTATPVFKSVDVLNIQTINPSGSIIFKGK
jgi:hypothetical protein